MAQPREHDQHLRHANFSRVRHSKQLLAFLSTQATRLSSTSSVIFAKLKKYTADKIRSAANIGQLP